MNRWSMIQQVVIDSFIVIIEGLKQLIVMNGIKHTTSFPNRMHSQHRHPNIDTFHPRSTGNNGPNRRSARWIVLDNEILDGNVSFLGYDSEEGGWDEITGVSLVEVCLYYDAFVHLDLVVYLVLVGIVGVDSVCHVCWDEEWFLHRFEEVVFVVYLLIDQ